ncbi:AAA family ATPase [Cellulomonas phragmiteti]|uniref:ATPase AAA-type core domain-containing protein n=1 Tax=Cellulomonas phragmiteti TaxID=478780 RepID=A0ABQ4DKA9_9CELL|nr:AAA family ATPase [Cellulomonas phragmiteti]GIG39366.1 hypothetical protein Cph01nite_11280 [Cellulomonas phragmiteti]
MKFERIYVRFFRSFNFDYERKAHRGAREAPWERTELGWYPYVRMDVDPRITAVVGANESGKSHLLDAVQRLLTDQVVDRQDFCRYSDLYSVELGERRVSDFAGRFRPDSEADRALMSGLGYDPDDDLYFVRAGTGAPFVFTQRQSEARELTPAQEQSLRDSFPVVFRLETEIALPVSMSVRRLADDESAALPRRARRRQILESLPKPDSTEKQASAWLVAIADLLRPVPTSSDADARAENEFNLGRSLLVDVAKIDPSSFGDLHAALEAEREGEVNAIIQRMNEAIARHLNFPKWWAQDQDFQLLLSPREHEVAFTVRDRTGSEYSFAERSRGLRYFLSYYVQLRANRAPEGRRQLLLLDEPDAYLSGVGQQDLLRILEEFAMPEDGSEGGQVLYVTHSPYLINRNAAHRIRVLDKGSDDEGTRVVTDASRNHYEPLRSALGPFVAETAFIGGANLFVEGLADQVLLAGVSSHLRGLYGTAPSQTLNLNEVTIVPAGSASAIPYLVYLARGRDQVRPPCVVLLDGDDSGHEASRKLRRAPVGRGRSIADEFIVVVDEWAVTAGIEGESGIAVQEPEDLITSAVAAEAANRYAKVVLGIDTVNGVRLTPEVIQAELPIRHSMWEAVVAVFGEVHAGEHIEKVGFAREVVGVLHDGGPVGSLHEAIEVTRDRFRALLGHLADLLRDARATEDDAQQRDRVGRLVRGFLKDHPDGVTKDRAKLLFREIARALEDTEEGDARRTELADMRRRYQLDREPLAQVHDYPRFRDELASLRLQERLARQGRPVEDEPSTATMSTDMVAPSAHSPATRPEALPQPSGREASPVSAAP